jgi:hypothetical protein
VFFGWWIWLWRKNALSISNSKPEIKLVTYKSTSQSYYHEHELTILFHKKILRYLGIESKYFSDFFVFFRWWIWYWLWRKNELSIFNSKPEKKLVTYKSTHTNLLSWAWANYTLYSTEVDTHHKLCLVSCFLLTWLILSNSIISIQLLLVVLLAQARYESGGVPMASVIRYSPPLSRSFRVCADTIIIRLLPDAVRSQELCRCMSRHSASWTNWDVVTLGS